MTAFALRNSDRNNRKGVGTCRSNANTRASLRVWLERRGGAMASVISEGEEIRRKVEARRDEDDVLLLLEQSPKLSQSEIAERLGWHDNAGKPKKRRAQTALAKLVGQQLIEPLRAGGYKLTKQGESETSDLRGERWREEIGSASAAAIVGSAHGLNDRTDTAPHGFAYD